MDPWSFGSNGKGLLFSDEMDLPVDDFARSRKSLLEWEARPYYNFENSAAESVEFMELGFTDITRKHFHNNQAVEVYDSEVGGDYGKSVASPTCMLTPHSSFGDPKSGWKPSGSVMECNSQNSSLIDLKLGRVVDHNGADSKFSNGRSVLASGGSDLVAKRARTTSSCPRTPLCQVQGCNMDLSSSKNYHQRHKVCEAHSKTARVIVNGMEQRFCQQCSRFHLLVEFDNGKRSCRKRLAGHNERRRKPQLASFSGKPYKLHHSIQGTRFLATSVPQRSPFVFPNIHQGGILYQDKYGEANQYMHMKLERESLFNPNGPLLANSFHLHNTGKEHCYDTASNVQELSGGSNSSCALSLLSTQSNALSSYPAGIPMGSNNPFYPGEHAYHVSDNISERSVMLINGEIHTGNGFYSSMTNPIDVEHFEVHSKGNLHSSGFPNFNHPLSPEHGTTIDLLQLSSHLQRVEQQRSSMPVKQEYEDFSSFLATREA